MNDQHTQHLFQKYPQSYRYREEGDQYVSAKHCSLMVFGFCVGDGWFDLIDDFSAKLEDLIKDIPDDVHDKPYVFQVKDKFGRLCIYVEHQTLAIGKLVDKAERKAKVTCSKCGLRGNLCSGKCD